MSAARVATIACAYILLSDVTPVLPKTKIGQLAKHLSAAYRHRFTMSDLEGLSVGDDVLRYFNSGLYDTKIVKRYRLVYIPQRQGEMWEVHYSFWHASGVCQFIPCGWNDLCECYHQENPTFVMTYD